MSRTTQTTLVANLSPQLSERWIDSTQLSVQQVQERLAQSQYPSLRQIRCESVDGSFVLWGTVSTYYTKQLAQALAGSVVGIERIKNRIVVELNASPR
jgi:hypothetical protein